MNIESAHKNVIFLPKHNMDLSKALEAQKGSLLDYESEFKSTADL